MFRVNYGLRIALLPSLTHDSIVVLNEANLIYLSLFIFSWIVSDLS